MVGGGYVGLVTSACLAELGHQVRCLESDRNKLNLLRSGNMPIHEPQLAELWNKHSVSGRLAVTDDPGAALSLANFVFIAVGTPQSGNGSADLSYVESAIRTVVEFSDMARVICIKSTVPPGTCARIQHDIRRKTGDQQGWTVVSNPEFLSQGRAVQDFLNPDRIVVGSSSEAISSSVAELYAALNAPVVITDSTGSELVKYASNSFLAMKISFINEISRLCEVTGTDVGSVAAGMGLDSRIGGKFLEAGLGWGGSCFPKDTAALERLMDDAGIGHDLITATRSVNTEQVNHIVQKIESMVDVADQPSVAVLGLTFKAGTDDLRGSQAIPLIEQLLQAGYTVRTYDPINPALSPDIARRVTRCSSLDEALMGSSAMVISTAWPELISMDFAAAGKLMRSRVVVDARRVLDPGLFKDLGFSYYRPGDGRQLVGAAASGIASGTEMEQVAA